MALWRIVFYPRSGDRHSPYDYLRDLPDVKAEAQIVHRLKTISELPLADWPNWTHHIVDKIYQLTSGAYRVMYFFDGFDIMIVHAFRKKSRKTPSVDVNRALAHYERYFGR